MKPQFTIGLTCLLLALGGCKTHRPAGEAGGAPGAETAASQASSGQGAATSGIGAGAAVSGDSGAGVTGPQTGLLAKRIVYFDFDRAELKPEGADIVSAHGRYLAGNVNARVRLEGHTDERGTREYNIGLGERRAQTVRRALMLQGAAAAQVTTVSYGEERPAAAGSDESAWAQNRRVEIIYLAP
jgi:peptidoglycan-associated lipoprotein